MFKFLLMFLVSGFMVNLLLAQNPPAANQETNTENNQQTENNANVSNRIDYGQLDDESVLYPKMNYEDSLYKLTLFNFEKIGEWSVFMPSDYGHAYIDEKNGVPLKLSEEKEEIQTLSSQDQETKQQGKAYFEIAKDPKKQILGLKVNFYSGRKDSWVRISPPQKVFLEGEVKGFEVWVAGRSIPHSMYILLEDLNGKEKLISLGKLNFQGWRRLSVRVPDSIIQEDARRSFKRGLTFKGIVVNFDIRDAFGTYYFYMDNLSVELSRYKEEAIAPDNPQDRYLW